MLNFKKITMIQFKSKLIALVGVIVLNYSCTNDLDVTPKDDDIFLSENFFNNPNSYKQGLAGVYGNLSLTGITGAGSSNIQGLDPGTSQYGRCLGILARTSEGEKYYELSGDMKLENKNDIKTF
jgi:hypothetical protein